MADVVEIRRQAFLRTQHRHAARIRQVVVWLGNVSYTLGALALGDLLFAGPRHVAGELILAILSTMSLMTTLVVAPLGEAR